MNNEIRQAVMYALNSLRLDILEMEKDNKMMHKHFEEQEGEDKAKLAYFVSSRAYEDRDIASHIDEILIKIRKEMKKDA